MCVRPSADGTRDILVPDTFKGRARWLTQKQFDDENSQMSYFFGHSFPKLGVGKAATGRPEL